MMFQLPEGRVALGLILGLAVAGCSDGEVQIEREVITNTVTDVRVVTTTVTIPAAACSPAAPSGLCGVGESCVGGTCMTTASLCSPTNLLGSCPDGTTCFGGGCVLISALCGPANPDGPCEAGQVCLSGECALSAELCSTSNLEGICPTGEVCTDGQCAAPGVDPCTVRVNTEQPEIGVDTRTAITVDGLQFKDSSGDGQLQPYEDWRLTELCRARDLATRLSVREKVGLMSEGSTIGSGTQDGTIAETTRARIVDDHLRQALIRLGTRSGPELAVYLNAIQRLAEAQPWSIPFVVTADPVHGFVLNTNATTGVQTLGASTVVSPWPQPLGLGAINDAAVTRAYGDVVRSEFMSMGFRWQLGPMADLATEPRWARVQNTFGENAFAVAKHAKACVEGFQAAGDGGLKNGIAATIKHFPGAGANQDGMDSHSRPGKFNVFPANNFEYHQIPFQAVMDAKPAAAMPCYSIFKSQTDWDPEQVGGAFSTGLVTRYLKQTLGFDGMVTSDWSTMSGTSWGVEALTQPERLAKFLRAGSHQLGSDSYTIVQTAFDRGFVTEEEITTAAVKILEVTFKLGLFENPYVDPTAPDVRSVANRLAGFEAQKKAIVILKNAEHAPAGGAATRYLPISGSRYSDTNRNMVADLGEYTCDTDADGTVEVYYDGVNDSLAGSDYLDDALQAYVYTSTGGAAALPVVTVASAADADIAVVRVSARKGTYFGLDAGVPLSFDAPFPGLQADSSLPVSIRERNKILDLFRARDGYTNAGGVAVPATKPTLKIVLVMHMDRPGIVAPFINGLVSLDETPGQAGSYPLVSNPANTRADGRGGVDGFLVEFGAFDRAVLDVLFNVNVPTTPMGYVYGQARLPMEIPSTDAQVDVQFEDLPADTLAPTYALGAGSTY